MGGLLSLWVLILIPFNGSLVFRSRSGAEYSAGFIILVYLLGGISTGALFGSMAYLLRGRFGAFCLGVVAAVPLGFGILITENHFATWTTKEGITVVLFAFFMGGPGGLIIREFATRSADGEYFKR
jgi:hypothetical protein